MKTNYLILLLTATCLGGAVAQDPPATPALAPAEVLDVPSLTIEARGLGSKPVPLFFSARANTTITTTADGWRSESEIQFELLQGKADTVSIKLLGDGTITAVDCPGILDWAVRRTIENGAPVRLLDIRPGEGMRSFKATVHASQDKLQLPADTSPLTFGPGKAIGFSSSITVNSDTSTDVRIAKAEGLSPAQPAAGSAPRTLGFLAQGDHALTLTLTRGGAALAPVELVNAELQGSIDAETRSASFILTAEARVTAEGGGFVDLLSGHAAVSALPEDPNFTLRLHGSDPPAYRLTFSEAGTYPVRIEFQAGLLARDSWQSTDFRIPAGAVVPVRLDGIEKDVRFDTSLPVLPTSRGDQHVGFLPADGHCNFAWQPARDAGEGKLFFSSEARVETRIGAGLMRQTATVELKILQGKLDGLEVLIEGAGEILSVEGNNILGWTIDVAGDGQRLLKIDSSRPATGGEQIVIRSQTPLGDAPIEAAPLRFTPQGSVRHSGYITVLSEGAVALEITKPSGLIQLAPGAPPAGVRQMFLYRFPSAQHSYGVSARQIFPEVSVSQTTVYQMTETDRMIVARIELDIAKAPLREWTLDIPEDYLVVRASGAEFDDFIPLEDEAAGTNSVKILFKSAVSGRQLVELTLGRSIAAAEGEWQLPPLAFPDAKSVRGDIGVATVAGYRASTGTLDKLTEVPQNLFPFGFPGLQQTYRQRDVAWTASVQIDALPQSVQADVFHLYSLKEGVAHGSVLINYFVIGSPVSEWRIDVPEEIGNVAIEGQNVQGWNRADGQITVNLHQPALGAATLLLTFEQPMNARGGILKPGQIAPAGVQGERGYIQIVSPSQVRHTINAPPSSLLKMESVELPAEFRLLSSSPSLAVYQYSSRPFELQMDIQWFQPGETVDQLVDFAQLESRVSSDGQVVTDALFFVKTRGRKALRMKLAEGTRLWEAKVDGETVSPKVDNGETLIPIAASIDPSVPVQVLVSIGQKSADARRPLVTSPILLAPTLISTWKVTGDPGRRLVPTGSDTPELAVPSRTETGFEWLHYRASPLLPWLAFAILAGSVLCCCARAGSARQFLGLVALLAAIGLSVALAFQANSERRVNRTNLEFVAPVIETGEAVTLQLRDVEPWQALASTPGIALAAVGLAILIFSLAARRLRWLVLPAWLLIAAGLLAQHGGAILFFAALALFILWHAVLPTFHSCCRAVAESRKQQALAAGEEGAEEDSDPDPAGPSATSGAVSSILILACAAAIGLTPGQASAAQDDQHPIADTASQSLRIEDGRLFGELEFAVTGKTSDTLLFLRAPAILTKFESDGMRVTKRTSEGGPTDYWVVLERDGTSAAKLSYELALGGSPNAFSLPTATAAVHQLEVRADQAGWQILADRAVRSEPLADLPAGTSGARFMLAPSASSVGISLQPKTRDLAAEEATFFVEVSNLFIPGPGIVDGRHSIIVRPSRGQLDQLNCTVPDGFTVSDVRASNLSGWRFDPDAKSLQIDFNPPLSKPFPIAIETQQGSDALPTELTLQPVTVQGAEGQVGMLGIAFGPDAQPEKSLPTGLSKVNVEDFDPTLVASLPKPAENGQPTHSMHEAYRYGAEPGSLQLTVGPVAPDIRAQVVQTLSLGEERLVIAIDLGVTITRSGIFKLTFPIPDGLEVEAASGDSLASHTESLQDGKRIATLHLNGRTLGQQNFSISLAGAAPAAQAEWAVPKFTITEASRASGQIRIVPEQGIRLQPVVRDRVTQIDSRKLSNSLPGTLAFRQLQADWELKLRIETLQPWVTAQILQEVTAREGLTRTRLSIGYKVENAAVKALRVRLPGLSDAEQDTLRASGNAVSHIAKLPAAEGGDLWEIHFQRRILGSGRIDVDYQRTTDRADGIETISVAEFVSARQAAHWVAVRVSGHLEVEPIIPVTSGWQPVDWASIPESLAGSRNRELPDLAYRASSPDQPLRVKVQRHAIADALRLRVSGGRFTTVVATDGASVTEARLLVEVVEKSTLRVVLPAGATLINTFVNSQSAGVVRESDTEGSDSDAHLFYVLPPEDGSAAEVSIAWSLPADAGRRFRLAGPKLNIPLQNIKWDLILPTGYRAQNVSGTLDPIGEAANIHYGLEDYLREQRERRQSENEDADRLMVQANEWKLSGDQEKARSAFSKLARQGNLSAATNEDARVQLRELQSERTLLSLATRRQRNYLFNVGEDPSLERNQSLEVAADQNPLLQGKTNYDPSVIPQLLSGNSSSEAAADRRITARLVSQQLAAEPALQSIDFTLPKEGHLLTFGRSVQVDGGKPLELELKIAKENRAPLWVLIPIILLLSILYLSTNQRSGGISPGGSN